MEESAHLLSRPVSVDVSDNASPLPPASENAALHPKTFCYESSDLDASESALSRQAARATSNTSLYVFYATRWGLVILVAMMTAVMALTISEGCKYVKRLAIYAAESAEPQSEALAIFAYVSVSAVFAAVGGFLVYKFDPALRGTLSETLAYLNGIVVNEGMRVTHLIPAVLGVIFSTSTMAVGKEGPMLAIGGQVGSAVSNLHAELSEEERRNFVSIGLGTGISCAFGAPAGAILFTLEKGFHFSIGLLIKLFVASMVACVVLNMFITGIDYSEWGTFVQQSLSHFGFFSRYEFGVQHLMGFILLGVIGGLLGALYVFLNIVSIRFRRRFITTPFGRFMEVIIIATFTLLVACSLSYWANWCVSANEVGSDDTLGNEFELVTLFCPSGQYNQMATLFMNLQEPAIRYLFHSEGDINIAVLIVFSSVFFLLSIYAVGSAVPSGFFLPSLLIGAAVGRIFGQCLSSQDFSMDPGVMSFLGAAAVLGGVSRTPVSLCVIMCEATDQTTYIMPLMITLMIARWVGDIFTPPITKCHLRFKDYPMLEWTAPSALRSYGVKQIMARPLATLTRFSTLSKIIDVISNTVHNGFPVVEADDAPDGFAGTLVGIVGRAQLLKLLSKAYETGQGMNEKIDLGPMSRHVLTVPAQTSCTRVFNIFRVLGLRHMVVTDQRNIPVGIVTRKDLFFLHESVMRNEHKAQQRSLAERITAALYGHAVHQ